MYIYSSTGFLRILAVIYFEHGSPHLKLALMLSPVNSKIVYIFDTSPYESMMIYVSDLSCYTRRFTSAKKT